MPQPSSMSDPVLAGLVAVRGDLAGIVVASDDAALRLGAARRELGRLAAASSAASLARAAVPLDRALTCFALATLFYFA